MKRLLLILAALGWSATGAFAAETTEAERYAACMERARAAPAGGLAEAEAWLKEAETVAGRHCRAVALIGLGRDEEAVAALDALGRRIETRDPALAANLYRQAAMVRFEAGRLDAAAALQDRAFKLAPDSVELLIDRALLQGAQDDYAKALQTLERARALAPARADVLVLMASAHRRLGQPDLARESLGSALAVDPDNLAALLERGISRRLAGEEEGARADWERVRALGPASPEAESAAANLKLIDEPAPVDAPAE